MSSIPVGCRLDQTTIDEFDKLANEQGTTRAGLLKKIVLRELKRETGASLQSKVADLENRMKQLEKTLLTVAGAIAQR
ncbi:MAG: hypothetical protein AAF889_00075 [Cyanobacteria bacterium P01_D01_bin.73]